MEKNPEKRPVMLLFTGQAGAGKDTAASAMKEVLEERGHKVLITHYADLLKYICRAFLGWNGVKDEAGRAMLQYVGTEVFRERDPDIWVRFTADVVEAFPGEWDFVLIPDCRFPNEFTYMKERGFNPVLVEIRRPDLKSALTPEQKKHASETAMKGVIPHHTVINYESEEDNGERGLKGAAEAIVKELL